MEKKDLVDLVKAINSHTVVCKDIAKRYDMMSRSINDNNNRIKELNDKIAVLADNLNKIVK